MTKLPAWVEPGVSFAYFDHRYHVRGIVDGQVVLREWRPNKQRWNYTVEHPVWFEVVAKHIKKRRRRGALLKDD